MSEGLNDWVVLGEVWKDDDCEEGCEYLERTYCSDTGTDSECYLLCSTGSLATDCPKFESFKEAMENNDV